MRFWTWKRLLAPCAIVASMYLMVLGFQGKLPHFMAAFGWLLAALGVLIDFGLEYTEHKQKEAQAAFEAALSAHFDRQECCCEKDCSQCPDGHDGKKGE